MKIANATPRLKSDKRELLIMFICLYVFPELLIILLFIILYNITHKLQIMCNQVYIFFDENNLLFQKKIWI